MPITSVTSDAEALSLTVIGDYPVPLERLWNAWADPRQLEKFWGPETWPATFTRHDMAVGGRSHYYMTGPEGERSPNCFWEFSRVEALHLIEVTNGFALEDFSPDPAMPPMRMVFTFEKTSTGSRFTGVTYYESLESMEAEHRINAVLVQRIAYGQRMVRVVHGRSFRPGIRHQVTN
jgi:uncharacterized protein YndB with AHSA1/START domain